MKKFILSICAVVLMTMSACSEKDEGPLGNTDEQYKEVSEQVNTNIESIRSLVSLLKGDDIIESVTPIKEGGKEVGYTFTFAKSKPVSVYFENKNSTPAFGIKSDNNGDFYWTLSGEWLLDNAGNKILCNETSNSILPQLKVENNNWMLSVDNGKTWKKISPVSSSSQGNNKLFKDINVSDAESVTFTFVDGTKLVIPREPELTISFSEEKQILVKPNSTVTIDYTITGKTEGLKVEVVTSGNIKAEIKNSESSKGTITITASESIDENDKVILIAKNKSVSTSKTLSFEEQEFVKVTSETAYEIAAEGGTIKFNIETNTDYSISIPEEAKSWISVVESRAIRRETVRLNIVENNDVARSVEVFIINEKGEQLAKIQVSQNGEPPCFTVKNGSTIDVESKGGTIELNLETNTEYSVSISEEAKSWISVMETRAIRQETVTLSISENLGDTRSTIIKFVDKENNSLASISLNQTEEIIPIHSDMTKAFPDSYFRKYVLGKFDKNKDGIISEREALKVTEIILKGESYPPQTVYLEVYSLEGIQYFPNLKYLDCYITYIKSLDLSKNTALTELYCYDNSLTSLDITGCTSLTTLSCRDNKLTSLDLSNNTALTYLSCSDNKLTSLDLSNNTALTRLKCSENKLTSLNVSGCTALTELDFNSNNNLTTLDVSGCTALTKLDCKNRKLTSLDVTGCTALTKLDCSNNQLTTLDVSGCTVLKELHCYDNRLTSLDVSGYTSLTALDCYNNQLTSLDVSGCTALTTLDCYNNQLTSLDVSKNTALTSLKCNNNQLTSLDVSKNTALTELDCSSNQLTTLDISKNTALTELDCGSNQLTTLDVSKNTALTKLRCGSNQLTSLDVSRCPLTELYCNMSSLEFLFVKTGQRIQGITYMFRYDIYINPKTTIEYI